MTTRPKFSTVDDYLDSIDIDVRPILERIRTLAKDAVPTATECISYQMPALRLTKTFLYFAAFKKHIGIYPPVKGDAALEKALEPFRGEKGNLQFPLNQPMPYDLIELVVRALAKQYKS